MSGYKLADGSLSSIYKVGDEFEVVGRNIGSKVSIGDVVKFYRDDKTDSPWFHDGSWCCAWDSLKPTPETKRKVHYRETGKWLVLEGDYVAHTDMTFKQFKEWCDAAKACGFRLDHVNPNVCVITFADDEGDLVSSWYTDIGAKTNTTEEFLEFLEKEEKGVSKFKVGDKVKIRKDSMFYRDEESNPKDTRGEVDSIQHGGLGIKVEWDNGMFNAYSESDLEFWFTKADFKDGMRVEHRGGFESGLLFESFIAHHNGSIMSRCHLREFEDDLSHFQQSKFDITKVTDRDGTILFEREEEPTELTIEEIAEKFGLPVDRVRIKK